MQEIGSGLWDGTITFHSEANLYLGGWQWFNSGQGHQLNGKLDNLRIWDIALSQPEIDNLPQSNIGLITHYKFNAGTVDILYDHSGNQNHGTINGARWITNGTKHVAGDGSDETGNGSLDSPFHSIQYAIDIASDGDTVLVSAGTYFENINFNGKNIALIGEDRETTIIDGGQNGSVVSIIYSGENETTLLSNFTLINGNSQHGGGISCIDSSPQLSNLIIKNNNAENDGGGISFISDFVITPVLSNTIIVNNTASGDDSHRLGGGIACTWLSSPTIINCTVVNNSANGKGGGLAVLHNSTPTIINSIIYNNSSPHIYIGHQNGAPPPNLTFRYSDIYYDILNEIDGTINWSNDSIDADPQFVDPENGDYTLQSTSPCIDAGDPNSPLDPDGTIADMGAFYFPQVGGCTDSYATNYDDTANVDDGSCTYPDAGDYSLSFDGLGEYVGLNENIIILDGGDYTIKSKLKFPLPLTSCNGMDISHNVLVSHIDMPGNGKHFLGVHGPTNQLEIYDTIEGGGNSPESGDGWWLSGYDVSDLEGWHEIAITAGNGVTNFFVDNSFVGSVNHIVSGEVAYYGNYTPYYYNGCEWAGSMDELIIYNKQLTEEELSSGDLTNEILIAHYKFNAGDGTTLYDHSGNQNHGTIYGATWYMEGCTDPLADNYNPDATVDDGSCIGSMYENYSLSFDGENDYVDCGNDNSFNITEEITILTWAKRNASVAPNWLVSKNRDITGGYHLFYASDQSISGKVNTSNGGVVSCSYPYPENNEWEYIAFTYNKNLGAKLYLNNTLVDSADANGIIDIDQNVSNLNIGRLDWEGGLYEFNGFMDNLSIFNRELSHEEIQANMYSDFPVDEEGLVAYWDFNEGTGTTLYDHSSNGNDGAINGATWVESTYGCSTEPNACNYEAEGSFDFEICLYDDCEGVCGGDAPEDNCGVCYGDNSTCEIQSTQMAVYYFSSISLDGISLTPGGSILARNEESGMVVGSGIYGNAGGDITEVIIMGEEQMDLDGWTCDSGPVSTCGMMLPGEIPQFYVNGHKANYVASDGTILQNIPPFYPIQVFINLTLDLQTDCNDDMGGAAFLDSCEVCSGGNSGHEPDSDQDCNGDCFEEALEDSCDVCSGGNSGHEADSDIDCNGDCFEQALEDNCGVCSGGNSSHEADSDIDDCGVCFGGNENKDCNGDCFGNAWESDCGCVAYIDGETEGDWCDDCDGVPYGGAIEDECGVCDDNYNNDSYNLEIILDGNANLISFPALPENLDYSVENIFGGLCDNQSPVIFEYPIAVIGENTACYCDNGHFYGSLNGVAQDEGYWVILNTFPDTLVIECAVPVSYNGNGNGDGQVEYELQNGNNLISYPFQTTQSLDDALGDASSFVFGLFGGGMAALNCTNYTCNNGYDGWIGSLEAFEGGKGYWLLTGEDTTFTFNEPEGGLARIAHQPALRPVPEVLRFMQSSKQAFYFIESATIYGKVLDDEDIIIAYNGDIVVGARYWNGEYTDVPAMGIDEYSNSEGYCKSGDRVSFKVWDASSNELIDMETDIETAWHDLSLSVINITEILPDDFSLDRAYPNPFNPTTTLSFALPIETEVTITIYNLQGREVISLVEGNMKAGYHSVVWNADRHSSGVYFVKMIAGEYVKTQKLMLVK